MIATSHWGRFHVKFQGKTDIAIRDCAKTTWREGGGEGGMGEICPKSKSYPRLIKQNPLSHNDNIKAHPGFLKAKYFEILDEKRSVSNFGGGNEFSIPKIFCL